MDTNHQPFFLVTGASGYVGNELVKYLKGRGINVRAMIKDPLKANSLEGYGAEIVIGDLRNKESLKKACKGVYGIYHIASIFRQAGYPEKVFHEVNAEGTRSLLDIAVEEGVKRFIHCSTGGVLGHIADPPGNEDSPYNPGDMYQRSKLEGEKIALSYFRAGKIKGVVIRPAMIYGPGDTRNLKLFKMIARGRFFYVGGGKQSVHFVDVRDLVVAFHLAMKHEELNGKIYHIPGEKAVPLREMVNLVADYLKVSRPWIHLPVKPMQLLGSVCEIICRPFGIQPPIFRRRVDFFTKNRHFDGSKAERELGFKPAKKFKEEVIEVIEWYKEHACL